MRLTASSASFGVAALVLSLFLGFGTTNANAADVQGLLEAGFSLYQQGDLDGAKRKFEEALLQDVTEEDALNWIDAIGYEALIKMMGSDHNGLTKLIATLEKLAATEIRRRSSDQTMITEALAAYFGSQDWGQALRLRHKMVNEFGLYLVPGLVEALGSSEHEQRVSAILTLVDLGTDTVIPLCVASTIDNPQVQAGVIAALKQIKHANSLGSLKLMAESASESVTRDQAMRAIKAIDSSKSGKSAHALLLDEATHFYLDSGYLNPTHHDPVVFEVDGGALTYRSVPEWALNELRAEQRITAALAIDSSDNEGRVLFASNNLARYSEYQTVEEVVARRVASGSMNESKQAELRQMAVEMRQVRNRALATSRATLMGALARAMAEGRTDVAVASIEAFRALVPVSGHAQSVPAELSAALSYAHRGVRFHAAEALAHLNPSAPFSGFERVIPELLEGLTKAGGFSALTVFASGSDSLKAQSLLRAANVATSNATSGIEALERALNAPHDIIVIGTDLGMTIPSADFIRRMRRDYRTQNTPILVMATDDELVATKATFENASIAVTVINRSIDPLRLRDDILLPLFANQGGERARSAAIAGRAARSIQFLAGSDTIFDLANASAAIAEVLENRTDAVRIPACEAARALGAKAAESNLVKIIEEGENASENLRVAALRALGAINRDNTSLDQRVARVLAAALGDTNANVATAAAHAYGETGISPAIMKIEK